MRHLILLASAALLLVSCGSGKGEPREEELEVRSLHTFEFVWEEVQKTLNLDWDIESKDLETRTIVTLWHEQLSPFSHQGKRRRLTVKVLGDQDEGWRVQATEEAEVNTNQENPLNSSEADWDGTGTEGSAAASFLIHLERRINPRSTWRESTIR